MIAQTNPGEGFFARKNTFSFFGAYSNDSSHILLGVAENRKLLDFGAGYSRRLFVDHIVNWQYSFEILPVALDSDPAVSYTHLDVYKRQVSCRVQRWCALSVRGK